MSNAEELQNFIKVMENAFAKGNATQTEDLARIFNKLAQELVASIGNLSISIDALSKLVGGSRKGGKAKKEGDADDAKTADTPADGGKPADAPAKAAPKRAQNTKMLFKEKFSKNVEFRDKYYTEKFKAEFEKHPDVLKKKNPTTKLSAIAELVYDNIKTNDDALFKQLIAEITTDDSANTVAAEPASP